MSLKIGWDIEVFANPDTFTGWTIGGLDETLEGIVAQVDELRAQGFGHSSMFEWSAKNKFNLEIHILNEKGERNAFTFMKIHIYQLADLTGNIPNRYAFLLDS